MKYTLDTLPVLDAYRENSECPLCRLRIACEDQYVDSMLGAAYMEPDCRVKTNEVGFCPRHFQLMFERAQPARPRADDAHALAAGRARSQNHSGKRRWLQGTACFASRRKERGFPRGENSGAPFRLRDLRTARRRAQPLRLYHRPALRAQTPNLSKCSTLQRASACRIWRLCWIWHKKHSLPRRPMRSARPSPP